MRVSNMTSSRGNDVPNQFIIQGVTVKIKNKNYTGTMFQSYSSNIAFQADNGETFLDDRYWDYSVTTGRYRNQFLSRNKKQTESLIKLGEYKLVNLN